MSVRLYGMTCGWLTMPFHFFLPGTEGWLAIPMECYLIQHPKGTALFDSGLEAAFKSKNPADIKATLGIFSELAFPELAQAEDVAERLRAFGVDPDKIDYLINSHLHFDHCGGNELIKNARHVIQKREWHAAVTPGLIEANLLIPRNYDLGHDRMEVDGEHDLFGDGSVVLIPTYGHTPGHQSLKVKLADGEVFLTGDSCYMRRTLEEMLLPDPMVTKNADQIRDTLHLLKRYRENGAQLIFGHDPNQWRHLNKGPISEITSAAVHNANRLHEPVKPTRMDSPFIGFYD